VFTAALPTIITYRAGSQPRYQWGLYGITGVGAGSTNYVFVVATAVLAWTVVVLGYRGARRPFAPLFLLWHGFVFLAMCYGAYQFGSTMEVRGDAMGIRINIALLGPALTGAILAACAWWTWRHASQSRDEVAWHWRRHSRLLMSLAGVLAVAIVVLFRRSPGHPHRDTDRLAIVLLVAQVAIVSRALLPEKRIV
jgi:hypothetical protein